MTEKEKIECRVKDYRLAREWSQDELAQRIGVRRQAIYDIESGRYLPNTAVAIRLGRVFGCRVEDLFVEVSLTETQPIDLIEGEKEGTRRVALARVRDRLVGIPLQGDEAISCGLRPADGLLTQDNKSVQVLLPPDHLDKTIILMGCDPAFGILGRYVGQKSSDARVHCRFASSHRALEGLSEGLAHVAGTHLHNTDAQESNVIAAGRKLAGKNSRIFGFSVLEEGLMVARGNPLGIRTVSDLAQPMVRFINRESGAALRILLDDHLRRAGVPPEAINGYHTEVASHREGAYRIACNVADAALGLRTIAEAFGLGFVPIAFARCDLVIPEDMVTGHPAVKILLDILQSAILRREINAIAGYEASVTGKTIAEL